MTMQRSPIAVPDGLCSPSDRLAGRCPDTVKNWFHVENAASPPTDAIDIVIDGPIVDPFMAEFLGIGVSSTQVVDAILSFRGQPLTVWINSEGGLITAGLAIYNQLLMHDAPVTTVVYGAAMSIASLIAMAGSTVIMAPASFLFIHEARNELDGTAADHRTQADLLDQLSDQIAGVYARRGDSRVNWRALMQAGSGPMQGTLLTAEDAVKRHLADRIDTQIARQPVNLVDFERYSLARGFETAVNRVDLEPLPGALNQAVAVHHTDTTDVAWDDAANRKNAKSGETESYYRDIFAWQDPDKDATTKDAWSFTHHMVSADGTPGAANQTACSSAIGVLNGARIQKGDSTPWTADRAAIHAHLAAHLQDANKDDPNYEPPPLKASMAIDAENAMSGTSGCCDASGCPDCGDCGDCGDCQAGDGCQCMDCPAMSDSTNTLTIRAAERALHTAGFSNSRARSIVAKGWQEADRDDPSSSSGMGEPKPEAEVAQPSAAAQVLIEARNREAYLASMAWATSTAKG